MNMRVQANAAAGSRETISIDAAQEFHRRMANAIEKVQAGIWAAGVHDLLGYATDFGFGHGRGMQTLALKTSRKSAYLRFKWETVLSNAAADQDQVTEAIRSAIIELS